MQRTATTVCVHECARVRAHAWALVRVCARARVRVCMRDVFVIYDEIFDPC